MEEELRNAEADHPLLLTPPASHSALRNGEEGCIIQPATLMEQIGC